MVPSGIISFQSLLQPVTVFDALVSLKPTNIVLKSHLHTAHSHPSTLTINSVIFDVYIAECRTSTVQNNMVIIVN